MAASNGHEGAVLYYQEGLEQSPAVKAATAEYFEENDTLQQWLNDSVELGPDFREKADRVYINYRGWASGQGFKFPMTRPKFTAKLKAKGIICKTASLPKEPNSVRCYIGIKIVVDHDGDGRSWDF